MPNLEDLTAERRGPGMANWNNYRRCIEAVIGRCYPTNSNPELAAAPVLFYPEELKEFQELDSTATCLDTFRAVRAGLSDERYWFMLRWVWLRYGYPVDRAAAVKELFCASRRRWAMLMTPREHMIRLGPIPVTVYQGGSIAEAGRMWSWSTNHEIAKGFAIKEQANGARVVRGKLFKPISLACFHDYDEEEFVADPRLVWGRRYTDDYPAPEPFMP
jgi:hypothetical protein